MGHHREPVLPPALSDTPLARMLARAVQQRASTAAVDPRGITVARAPAQAQGSSAPPAAGHGRAADRTGFVLLWTKIEMDVGNTTAHKDVYASFVRHAATFQQNPMFYAVVSDMYGQLDDLIAAYVDGSTIDQMAERAGV